MSAPAETSVPSGADGRAGTMAWPRRRQSLFLAIATLVILAAAADEIRRSLARMLWLDELYTTTLISTGSLPHLWQGIAWGLDANPPLYLTIAWAITHGTGVSTDLVLRVANLSFIATAMLLQYRIARRIADPVSAATALLGICALEVMPSYAILELRTYALYLCLSSAALLAALRLAERPSAPARAWMFAGAGILATLSHTFGGIYLGSMAGAVAAVALVRREPLLLRRALWAVTPGIAVFLLWVSIFLPAQSAMATPYGWLTAPGILGLLMALTGSIAITPVATIALVSLAIRRRRSIGRLKAWVQDRRNPAVLFASLAAFAGLTLALWLLSQVMTPSFTQRYFIPNLTIAAVLLALTIAWTQSRVRPGMFLLIPTLALVAGILGIEAGRPAYFGGVACVSDGGAFLESGLTEGLPVVAESPHAWLPRHEFSKSQTTLYPLDWDVVRLYPNKDRKNATDYQLMKMLAKWVGPQNGMANELLSTEQILARYDRFIVVNEAGRSWLDHLRAMHPLTMTLLAEGRDCKVWRVEQRP